MSRSTQIVCLLGLLALGTTSGCSILGKKEDSQFVENLDVRRAINFKKEKLPDPKIPTQIVSSWQETVFNRQGQKSQRGFGGRLMFFNRKSEDPIRVEGQLVVYAYDDTVRAEHETQPTRRYVFPREQFALHESQSKLGPSYSVWLPWDAVGGEQKNVSLIPRFEPVGGPLLVGEPTKHLLPGTTRLASGKKTPATKQISNIQLTQHTTAAPPLPELESKRPKATSISLSKQWKKRLGGSSKPTP